ncbi:hypothetical protein TTHERM_000383629 (macronuclear) [Tetrahymena thermophila SB210]|uniref:XRCC4 coiled-coil domain-containing protein n=1 Tax=Tetrahymena thermophila (strain SB210) TaxID=312017 RepID=W7XIC1_TETTS|nr:hypothetical protein TTHERM_000383629 [Tetrahymena thermophila SB210]EWS74506.1 hypothetical protein TTHERM_000383629 [Tetrahymena thermophila SB210]|eukprot:XP_012652991.1 hypothetical protein TTHERM_000383629 [Tetrahymena thermophila SB210]
MFALEQNTHSEEFNLFTKRETAQGQTIYLISSISKKFTITKKDKQSIGVIQCFISSIQNGKEQIQIFKAEMFNTDLNQEITWNNEYFDNILKQLNNKKSENHQFSLVSSNKPGDNSKILNINYIDQRIKYSLITVELQPHLVDSQFVYSFDCFQKLITAKNESVKSIQKQNEQLRKYNDLLKKQLTQQQEDAKKQEQQLIKKFAALLNEKKRMIRDSHNLSRENIDQIVNQINQLTIKCNPQKQNENNTTPLPTLGSFQPNSNSLFEPSQNFRKTKIEQDQINHSSNKQTHIIDLIENENDRNKANLQVEFQNKIKLEESSNKKKRNSELGYYLNPKVEVGISEEKRKSYRELLNQQDSQMIIIDDYQNEDSSRMINEKPLQPKQNKNQILQINEQFSQLLQNKNSSLKTSQKIPLNPFLLNENVKKLSNEKKKQKKNQMIDENQDNFDEDEDFNIDNEQASFTDLFQDYQEID